MASDRDRLSDRVAALRERLDAAASDDDRDPWRVHVECVEKAKRAYHAGRPDDRERYEQQAADAYMEMLRETGADEPVDGTPDGDTPRVRRDYRSCSISP